MVWHLHKRKSPSGDYRCCLTLQTVRAARAALGRERRQENRFARCWKRPSVGERCVTTSKELSLWGSSTLLRARVRGILLFRPDEARLGECRAGASLEFRRRRSHLPPGPPLRIAPGCAYLAGRAAAPPDHRVSNLAGGMPAHLGRLIVCDRKKCARKAILCNMLYISAELA